MAGGAYNAGEDLLGVGALAGAVAAAHLTGDDGGPDGLFSAPIGGVDRRVPQKGEDGGEFDGQVGGEALGVVQRRRVVDQPAEPGEQSAAGGGQTVVAQGAGVAPVAQREAGLQGVLHLAGPPAVGMILQQMLTTSPQVLQTRLVHPVGVAAVHHPPVAHEHAVEVGPQDRLRVVESAAGADGVDGRRRGDGRPQPVAEGADAPTGFIRRDHRRVADLLAQRLVGRPRVVGRTMQQIREAPRRDVQAEPVCSRSATWLPIVRKHLLPQQIAACGLRAGRLWAGLPEAGGEQVAAAEAAPVEMTDMAIRAMIRGHTCEAGVRQLERLVGAVCQHVAFRRVAAAEAAPVTVAADARDAERREAQAQHCVTIEELFGTPRYGSLPDKVRDAVSREWERLLALHPADPEAAAARDWIEVVEDLPWGRPARGRTEAAELRRLLDEAYVGRDEEKEQVLDHLAARGLTRQAAERSTAGAGEADEPVGTDRAVLCFWGPPGVGRTAFAAAVAAALGRRCVRVSLAGAAAAGAVRGVARNGREPAPGRIVTALRQGGQPQECKRPDPVCVLGGIDRMQDAAAHALLEVLDPLRNRAFRDRYVGLPLDLSTVTFVATANDPSEIPMPLLERLELVSLEEYAEAEKLRIAAEHLLPRQLGRHGLAPDDLSLSGEALRGLIRGYTREPGVWGLDRRIRALCRRAARRIAEGCPAPGAIGPDALVHWYGEPPYRGDDVTARTRRAGVAVGLAATAAGGEVLFVEAVRSRAAGGCG